MRGVELAIIQLMTSCFLKMCPMCGGWPGLAAG